MTTTTVTPIISLTFVWFPRRNDPNVDQAHKHLSRFPATHGVEVDPPPHKAHQGTSTVSNQLAPSQKKAQPGKEKTHHQSPIITPHLRSMQIFDVSLTNPKRHTIEDHQLSQLKTLKLGGCHKVGPKNVSYNFLLHSPVTYMFLTFPKIEAGEAPQFHGTQVFQDGWVDSERLS